MSKLFLKLIRVYSVILLEMFYNIPIYFGNNYLREYNINFKLYTCT